MGILQLTSCEFIEFDPAKVDHRQAYWELRTTGRQVGKLRFVLDAGFTNVLTMMQVKIADHFSKPARAVAEVTRLERKK